MRLLLLFALVALSQSFLFAPPRIQRSVASSKSLHKPLTAPHIILPSSRQSFVLYANDFYAQLGVSRSASEGEIKSGFRKMARKWHPDVNPSDEAKEEFQKISRAYEVLSDPSMRQRYDQFGEAGVSTSAAGGGGYGGPGMEVDLGDIFDSFFGGGGGGRGPGAGRQRQRGPVAGDDLRFDLEVDFQTAVFGGEEKVRIRHLEKCETCTGSGVKPGSQVRTCGTCGGTGVVMAVTRTPLGNFQTQQTCTSCRGTGQTVDEYCGTCSGQGLVQKTKQVKISIPAGVEDGNKLRVRGEGDAGPKGGPSGDLYIFLKVKPDKRFRREGPEIYSDVTVSYVDAILGASVKVPVVDGEVEIKIPPGTQPKQVMRIKGKGAPRLGNAQQRGDHYVTVNIEIPKTISDKEKALVESLRDLKK
eukprot:CAMPEP_0118661798 /NCGR_PEP_ID=MMETSP0785-20121206/16482_1 /TAXON_ID=91992 /ORGANISM="Bolidomonas pacifica, Strain CCMP 1866" /LENGTH=414 /DNA_ID=CAMNT_0006555283 /DNA_START=18 /DNA_END=1262 /DNA_ORIENTATION=+